MQCNAKFQPVELGIWIGFLNHITFLQLNLLFAFSFCIFISQLHILFVNFHMWYYDTHTIMVCDTTIKQLCLGFGGIDQDQEASRIFWVYSLSCTTVSHTSNIPYIVQGIKVAVEYGSRPAKYFLLFSGGRKSVFSLIEIRITCGWQGADNIIHSNFFGKLPRARAASWLLGPAATRLRHSTPAHVASYARLPTSLNRV